MSKPPAPEDAAATQAGRPYHHGDLPQALLRAAEQVLLREGLAGLGLRNIAREAGVSHTAPKHHFGDTAGLLSELAAVGYGRLETALQAARQAAGDDARARRNAIARAYVLFAHAQPAMFGLMFRNEIIDMQRPGLSAAAQAAMRVMAPTIGSALPSAGGAPSLSREDGMRITAAWAYVHGLATLLVDQRLRGIVKATPAFDDPLVLVDAVLREVPLGLDFDRR